MMIKTEDPSYIVDIKNPVGDGTPCNFIRFIFLRENIAIKEVL